MHLLSRHRHPRTSVGILSHSPARLALLIQLLAVVAPAASGQRPVTTLDTVRVTVSSRTVGTGVRSEDVITREEIDRRGGRTIADVLSDALGVEISRRSPAQADIAMRGSSTSQVLILVDGVRVSDLQANHFNLDLAVPLQAVDRIEILRGGGSTLYGPDAAGGVVNIITTGRDGAAANRHSLRAWGGSFGTGGAAASAADSLGAFGVQLSVEHERSDGHRFGTDYNVTQASVGANRLAGGGRLRARAGVGIRSFGASDFYATYPSHERTRSATGSLRYEFAPRDRVRASVTASTRRHSDDYVLVRDNPDLYHNRHITWQSGLESVARVALAPAVVAAVGVEASDARLRSERLGDREEERGALFAEATMGHAGAAQLNAGARIDWSSVNSTFISPSVGGVVPLGTWVRLRATAPSHASSSAGLGDGIWNLRRYSAVPCKRGPGVAALRERSQHPALPTWRGARACRDCARPGRGTPNGLRARADRDAGIRPARRTGRAPDGETMGAPGGRAWTDCAGRSRSI